MSIVCLLTVAGHFVNFVTSSEMNRNDQVCSDNWESKNEINTESSTSGGWEQTIINNILNSNISTINRNQSDKFCLNLRDRILVNPIADGYFFP